MKKFILAIPLCAATLSGFAQGKNQPMTLAVAPTQMNVLFIGCQNPLDIAVSGVSDDKLIVSSPDGTVTKKGDGKYDIDVKSTGTIVVKIAAKQKRDTVEIGQREFFAKRIPDPMLRVVGVKDYEGGLISKAEFMSTIGLEAYLPSDINFKFEVLSFSLSASIKGYNEFEFSDGCKFSSQQRDLVLKLKPDQKFFIEDIKVMGPDGSIRNMGSMAFKIKGNN